MATLSQIFPNITEDCYIDDRGVYKDGQKIAIDNAHNSAYTRRSGSRSLEKIGNFVYRVTQPMRLVATAPDADKDEFERAVINALDRCNYQVTGSTTDKRQIAQDELIDLEELKKFTNVAIVAVDFTKTTTELNDSSCDVAIC